MRHQKHEPSELNSRAQTEPGWTLVLIGLIVVLVARLGLSL